MRTRVFEDCQKLEPVELKLKGVGNAMLVQRVLVLLYPRHCWLQVAAADLHAVGGDAMCCTVLRHQETHLAEHVVHCHKGLLECIAALHTCLLHKHIASLKAAFLIQVLRNHLCCRRMQ